MTSKLRKFDIRRATLPLMIALAILLVANVAVYVGLVRPSVQEWRALNEENSPRAQALEERTRSVEEFEEYVGGLKQAKDDLDDLRSSLSTRDERLVHVQRELESIVSGEKIDLDSVAYDHPVLAAEGLQVLRMVVPLEGGYASLRTLLNNVEKSKFFLVVERVTIGQGQDGGVMLQLNVTIATYFNAPIEMPEERQTRRPRRA